jgi:hypothetical protein
VFAKQHQQKNICSPGFIQVVGVDFGIARRIKCEHQQWHREKVIGWLKKHF